MENTNPIFVETTAGKIRGFQKDSLEIFLGIPYAQPPVSELRFKPSVTKASWDGVLDCTQYGPIAPQRIDPVMNPGREAVQDEAECLSLNVSTPGTDNKKRPVMFWIHGGGFSFGSGSWTDGSKLAERGDVVVVTINYRVGIFGFLYVENRIANLGIQDMITALRWVKDNIAAFGGDPDNVTIFGESAGAVAVCCLLAMPDAKGLFHKAIAQSGTAHPRRHRPKAGIRGTTKVLEELGLKEIDMETLSKIPTEKIVKAQTKLELAARATGGDFPYGAYVDGTTLPQHPYTAVGEGYARDIPLMIGTNLDEAKLYSALRPPKQQPNEKSLVSIIHALFKPFGRDEAYAAKVIETYTLQRKGILPSEPQDIVDAVMTDIRFRIPALRWAEAQCGQQKNVYSYLFTYKSTALGGGLGACHALEIPFVFGTLGEKQRGIYPSRNSDTDNISAAMMDAWTSFAKCANPSHDRIGVWPGYDPDQRRTMVFGVDTHLESDPFGRERKLWDGMI